MFSMVLYKFFCHFEKNQNEKFDEVLQDGFNTKQMTEWLDD
jgi:hypothetical protein